MTNLTIGDTVIAKHNNIWQKGRITNIYVNLEIRHFYITFDDELKSSNGPYCRVDIIKVDSYFKIGCTNCKYWNKLGNDEPCYECLIKHNHCHWEPGDSLKNKDKIDYARCWHPLHHEKLDVVSFHPNFHEVKDLLPTHSDNIDALRYGIEFMADFNKKENKNMKKQQKRRNRNILVVKELNTAIEFDEIKFNGPATIIKWKPTFDQLAWDKKPDKTVVVCKEPDKFDKTTGFLLAVLKEILDNKSYGNILEKIDEIKEFDEFSKQTVEADLNNKTRLHHCSIKDLKEATEALENVYVPGSVVKYRNGKKYYKVLCYRFDEDIKEIVYILQAYKETCFTDNSLEHIYKRNIPHSKLIKVRRK